MPGLLDLLGLSSGPTLTQNGQALGPVDGGQGLLAQFTQRLRDNSDSLTGFGMGMLSGGNQQEGFANGLQGMQAGQQMAMKRKLLAQQEQQRAAKQQAAAAYAQKFPEYAGMLQANPDLAETFATKQFENSQRNPLDDDYKRAQIAKLQQDRQPSFAEKLYNTLSPEDQAQARKAQLGIVSENDYSKRAAAAEALGIKPDDPQYKSYVLTGKMPREDAQPLTATDKKAIMEADDGVLAANTAIENLSKAKQISKEAYTGPTAGTRGYITSIFGDKAGEKTQELDNLVQSNALSSLKSIFGGNPTEGERAILLEIQGSSSKSDEVRQGIYDRGIALAKKRLEFNQQRSNELRGGSFYKSGGGSASTPGAPPKNDTLSAADAIVGLGGKK
jgi:hypothetical protein